MYYDHTTNIHILVLEWYYNIVYISICTNPSTRMVHNVLERYQKYDKVLELVHNRA